MFKVLVIANLYGLSDRRTQFQITDRLSFKRFLGLSRCRQGTGQENDLGFSGVAAPRQSFFPVERTSPSTRPLCATCYKLSSSMPCWERSDLPICNA